MRPIAWETLNTVELTRTDFLSQENLDHVPIGSEIFSFFLLICGKNEENFEKVAKSNGY